MTPRTCLLLVGLYAAFIPRLAQGWLEYGCLPVPVWVDSQDRRIHSDWFVAHLDSDPPTDDTYFGVGLFNAHYYTGDFPLWHSLRSDYLLHSDWTYATNMSYAGRIYVRNYALREWDEAASFWVVYQTSPWPPPTGGISIGVIYQMQLQVYVDGMPFPEEVGPFRGTVSAFSENLTKDTDGPFRWGFEVVTRRISPNQEILSAGAETPALSLWETNADLVVADLTIGNYALHLPKITEALLAGRTIVVNHGTYTNLLNSLAVPLQDQHTNWLTDPLPSPNPVNWGETSPFAVGYADIASGRLINGSWGGANWTMGWLGSSCRAWPAVPYRDMARVLNRLVRNGVSSNTPPLPELLLSTPDDKTVFWGTPDPLVLRARCRGVQSMAGVEFFQDGFKVGEEWERPFCLTLNEVPSGEHTYSARVQTEHGMVTSADLVVVIATNTPAVTLLQPAAGASFGSLDQLSLQASADSPVGFFTNIQFLIDGQLVGETGTSPFGFVLPVNNLSLGPHSLSVLGLHDSGFAFTSPPVSIVVTGATLCVDSAGNDANDGLTWGSALQNIQTAVDRLGISGGEVWVRSSQYNENISVTGSIKLLGGFFGDEVSSEARAPALHPTLIMGGSNAPAVIYFGPGATNSALDGFIVQGGTADGSAILCTNSFPVISNCVVSNNPGFGIRVDQGVAMITGCLITSNSTGVACNYSSSQISSNQIVANASVGVSCYGSSIPVVSRNLVASNGGGGLNIVLCSPMIAGNVISYNTGGWGGGISVWGQAGPEARPVVANNVVAHNTASANGGGIALIWCQGHFPNNTIVSNAANEGAGVYSWSAYTKFDNNIVAFNDLPSGNSPGAGFFRGGAGTFDLNNNCVYGNGTNQYDGITPDPGTIHTNPQLVAEANGFIHIAASSPCIDAGYGAVVNASGTTSHPPVPFDILRDIDGQGRVAGANVDIGADESWVDATNLPPTLDSLIDVNLAEDAGHTVVQLSGISGGEGGPADGLRVYAQADNPSLITNLLVSYVPPQSTGSVAFDLVANASGLASITVTVRDTGNEAVGETSELSRTFAVQVSSINDPPQISRLQPRVAEVNTPIDTVPLLISDAETAADDLVLSITSSNLALLPNSNISILGGGSCRRILLEPIPDQEGESLITVSVNDGQYSSSEQFSLYVLASNPPPAIANIPTQTLQEGETLIVSNAVSDDLGCAVIFLARGPRGMIQSNLTYIWPTDESSGPSTNLIVTRAKDNWGCEIPEPLVQKTGWNYFTVIVNEVNESPTLPALPDIAGNYKAPLVVTNTAYDPDLPANPLTYAFIAAPSGAEIDASGIIRWTPMLSQLDNVQQFITVVDDGGTPLLTATNSFSVILTSTPPVLLTQPQSRTNLAGTTASFFATATSYTPPTYLWHHNDEIMADATNLDLFITNVQLVDAGEYYLVVTNHGGAVTSAVANLVVVSPPQITQQPSAQTVAIGSSFSFAVTAISDLPMTYQWRKGGQSLFDSSRTTGAEAPTLIVGGASSTDSGDYSVVIINSHASTTSIVAELDVTLPTPVADIDQPEAESVTIQFPCVVGLLYALESSTNLVDWEVLVSQVALSNLFVFAETNTSSDACRFYRTHVFYPPLPTDGLVAHYPLDGNAEEFSGYSNSGTNYGVTWTNGVLASSAVFNGAGIYIDVPNSPTLSPPQFTLSGWFWWQTTPPPGESFPISNYAEYHGWLMRMGPDMKPGFSVNRPYLGASAYSQHSIPLQSWVHVAMTYDGEIMSIYVNGVFDGDASFPGGYAPFSGLMKLGMASWVNSGWFNGKMDDVRIYNRVLSAEEILQLFLLPGGY